MMITPGDGQQHLGCLMSLNVVVLEEIGFGIGLFGG